VTSPLLSQNLSETLATVGRGSFLGGLLIDVAGLRAEIFDERFTIARGAAKLLDGSSAPRFQLRQHTNTPRVEGAIRRDASGGATTERRAARKGHAPSVGHASCSRRACNRCQLQGVGGMTPLRIVGAGTACKRRSGRFRSLSNIFSALTLLKG
jgi:hypothetical protein